MTDPTSSETKSFQFNAKPYSEVYQDALKILATPYPSFPTKHWPRFDDMIGGFRTKEFSILCAPTGVGKTQWLASLSALFLKEKIKHFVASVETGPIDFVARTMSVLAGKDLNTGKPVPLQMLKDFNDRYGPYFYNDTGLLSLYENRISLQHLLLTLEKSAEMGYKIAILDNLNFFLDIVTANQSIIEMDRVIHELIMLCKRIEIHIIMVMHPKKTENGRVESEFDIKGSSTAVQEAHNVFLLNRPTADEINRGDRKPTDRELLFRKLRRRGMYVGQSCWFNYSEGRYVETV